MHRVSAVTSAVLLLLSVSAIAQEANQTQPPPITVRGCLRSERGNYILIADRVGTVYVLQNVGAKLHGYLRKEVEVTGDAKPGRVRTGVRPEKSGDNPADTVHGVDGVPLQVRDIQKDIRVVANHCKAADQQ